MSRQFGLVEASRKVRRLVVEMAYKSKTAEVGSALSIVDILVALYWKVLRIDPKHPEAPARDRFILSKGHGAAALYAVLALKGFFPRTVLDGYRRNRGRLHGHPSRGMVPGIEVSTGSLGHGLSIAAGVGTALREDAPQARIFVLLGDGECNEGSVWEAAMFIATHGLKNVIVIIDANGFQGFGATREVHRMNLSRQWKAFGFRVKEVRGHNLSELVRILRGARVCAAPTVVIAKTRNGKGLPAVEDTLKAHYFIPDAEALRQSRKKI